VPVEHRPGFLGDRIVGLVARNRHRVYTAVIEPRAELLECSRVRRPGLLGHAFPV